MTLVTVTTYCNNCRTSYTDSFEDYVPVKEMKSFKPEEFKRRCCIVCPGCGAFAQRSDPYLTPGGNWLRSG